MAKKHYRTALHRTFQQAVVHLLETEYKLVGSHKVIQMIASDIANLHEEYYQHAAHVPPVGTSSGEPPWIQERNRRLANLQERSRPSAPYCL